jgi:hypothetical protein
MTTSTLGSQTRAFVLVSLVTLVGCAADVEQTASPAGAPGSSAADYVPPAVAAESHDLEQADFERLMSALSNWGRWGAEDQLGTANEARLARLAP